jgi:hypothetical protein
VLAQLARAKREFIAAPGAPPEITTKSSFFSTIWPLVFSAWKAQQAGKGAQTPHDPPHTPPPAGASPAAPAAATPRKRVRVRKPVPVTPDPWESDPETP